jgi:iron complex outermembrane receptor protein
VVRVEPAATPSGSGFGGEAVVNAFSNNRQGAGSIMVEHGSLALPLLGEAGARLRVSGRKAGEASTPDYTLRNTGFGELNIGATLGLTRGWGSSELHWSRFDTEIGLFTGAHVGNFDDLLRAMEQEPTRTDFEYAIANPRQEVTHDALRWQSHVHLSEIATLEGTYGFQRNRRSEYDSHGPVALQSRPAFGLDLYTHTLDLLVHHEETGPFRGSVGVSGMRQGNISTGKAFLIPQYRLYTGAAFLSEEATLGRLTLTGGIRYDHRWQHVYPFGDFGIVTVDETREYTGFSGSAGASVGFAEAWSIGGTIGRAWRAPNVNERFSQGVHHGTAQYELGDTTLVSERTWNLDVTLRRSGPRLGLEVSAYRNRISDYIFLEPRAPVQTIRGAYPAFNFRQTDAEITGLEVSVDARPTEALSVHASGSATRGTDGGTDGPLYDMPADRVRFGARLDLPERPWLGGPWLEVGVALVREQDRVPESIVYALPTDGYGLLDLAIGAEQVFVGRQRLEVSLSVENLLNRSYRDYLSRYKLFVDDPGRDLVLRVRMPFGATH